VQKTYQSLLTTLSELNIEVPMPMQKLLEAHAAGCHSDVKAWQAAIVESLDDEQIVKGTSDLMKKGEAVLTKFQGLKDSKTLGKVMEHLENQDLERDLLAKLHGMDPTKLVKTAEGALTNAKDRDELVSNMKDTLLEFILKVLPAIRIEKLDGHDNGCDWEISNISFSDFSFKKENVKIELGDPAKNEDIIRMSAWDISAHFKDLSVSVKQTHFPNIHAVGTADALAKRMSVAVSFRLQQQPGTSVPALHVVGKPSVSFQTSMREVGATLSAAASAARSGTGDIAPPPPRMVVSSRTVGMEILELNVHKSNYALIVNALTFLFADVLKDYACAKVAKHLDGHTDTLIEALNNLLDTGAPMLAKMGWQLPTSPPSAAEAAAAIRDDEDDEEVEVLSELEGLFFLDWADPGRTFPVRV